MDLRKLLLKDLSARLPYGIKCEIDNIDEPLELESIKFKGDYFIFGNGVYERYITEIKPYLRPMSSMTEEERNEYFDFRSQELQRVAFAEVGREEAISEVMDWLLSHHFDIRGLIEKGLALEAPKGMYGI